MRLDLSCVTPAGGVWHRSLPQLGSLDTCWVCRSGFSWWPTNGNRFTCKSPRHLAALHGDAVLSLQIQGV